jgi:hypothetical protein
MMARSHAPSRTRPAAPVHPARTEAGAHGGQAGLSDQPASPLDGELGLTQSIVWGTGAKRLSLGLQAAAGGTMGPGVIGKVTPEIEHDSKRCRAFRLGLSFTGEW